MMASPWPLSVRRSEGKDWERYGVAAVRCRDWRALGPSLGGVLIAGLSWRAIFLVNLPLGILIFSRRYLPVDRRGPGRSGRLDNVGTLLLALTPGLCTRHDDWARQFRSAQHACCWLLSSESALRAGGRRERHRL
jgi:hypothetical protein